MNESILIGRLTVDPDLKFISTGTAVAKFFIAVDRSYKKNNEKVTDFIPIEVWGKTAEYCANYITKGELVAVKGSLHIDRYIDKNSGENKSYAKIFCKQIQKLSFKKAQGDDVPDSPVGFQAIEDDDMPFF